jgi:hypothetical protein
LVKGRKIGRLEVTEAENCEERISALEGNRECRTGRQNNVPDNEKLKEKVIRRSTEVENEALTERK